MPLDPLAPKLTTWCEVCLRYFYQKPVCNGLYVNTQVQTYTQIPHPRPDSSLCPVTHSIPASCSIAAKRPSPSQPSALPSHDFVIPVLGWDANHFCKPSATSKGSNKMATSGLLAPVILTTGSQVYWKDHSINSPHSILIFSTHLFLFQHPWPSPSPFYLTLGHMIFLVRIIVHLWSP